LPVLLALLGLLPAHGIRLQSPLVVSVGSGRPASPMGGGKRCRTRDTNLWKVGGDRDRLTGSWGEGGWFCLFFVLSFSDSRSASRSGFRKSELLEVGSAWMTDGRVQLSPRSLPDGGPGELAVRHGKCVVWVFTAVASQVLIKQNHINATCINWPYFFKCFNANSRRFS
jgi:hypothetical protein